ncbi:crosslink repair DNA glycosylase YcaQ family protein, partial [Kitasatospora sp. NPDC007106]|uniref:DNA glycosylase AlkZ-like family protein n=1 Tax=Kitasatospora sp. NPDC007106 TaxID=3156914 RepID=UPI0033FEC352
MSLTARQLALAVLERQFLLERRCLDVAEAVRRLCALQAQAPASPYLALWNRVQDFAPEDLDAAWRGPGAGGECPRTIRRRPVPRQPGRSCAAR